MKNLDDIKLSRRSMLAGVAVGASLLAMSPSTLAAPQPRQPEADTGQSYKMPKPNPKTEKELRLGGIGMMMLNLKTSEIAVDRASDPRVKEFANFELREQLGGTKVFKEMGTPVPAMDADSKATLEKLQAMSAGPEFDRAYLQLQVQTHEFLRDANVAYLKNSEGKKTPAEMHGRHLSTLMLGQIKDHVVLSKALLGKLGS